MIVPKDFLSKLKDFGLNSYESKLWVALLSRGISTAGELSDISNVPRSRAYDVLESLEKKGFIMVKVGKPIKYLAVPPREVVERVKSKVTEDAKQKTGVLDQLKDSDVLGELNQLHSTGIELVDPTDKSGSFRGRNKVYEHLSAMIKNSQKEIILMTTKKGLERKYDSLYAPLKKAANRGVTIKIVVPTNAAKETLTHFSKISEIRNTKNDARFCIIDNNELLLMMTEDKKVHPDYDCGVWVEAPYFVDYFAKLFNTEWSSLR
ncbi:TrmB family transcriptional regulator [Candidatus Woesearchaeota archaeon]|nr:TrmB family transcriptional regulator [Candidatus Woesearchaeota archaeon]